jgi:hypothetical protein
MATIGQTMKEADERRKAIRANSFTMLRTLKETDRIFNGDQTPCEADLQSLARHVDKLLVEMGEKG